eukprot:gene10882-22721_t
MGSGTSSSHQTFRSQRDKKSMRLLTTKDSADNFSSFRNIDQFLLIILLKSSYDEAIKVVVKNPNALASLVKFLALELLHTVNTPIVESLIEGSHLSKSVKFDLICQIIKKSLEGFMASTSSSLFSTTENDTSSNSTLAMFIRSMFTEFLHSHFFYDWRVKETSEALIALNENVKMECTLPELESLSCELDKNKKSPVVASVLHSNDLIGTVSATITSNSSEASCKTKYLEEPIGLPVDDDITSPSFKFKQLLQNCDPIEVPKLLKYDRDGWMTSFLIAAETLPIGITLSSISRERPGYPVIYLNKHFADHSGYKREDVLGERFGFMQRTGTRILKHSEASVSLATVALGTAQSVIVSIDITHLYNDYTSIVGIKPIFDNHGNYKFVIGLHLEIKKTSTSNQNIEGEIKLVTDLIDALPSTIC